MLKFNKKIIALVLPSLLTANVVANTEKPVQPYFIEDNNAKSNLRTVDNKDGVFDLQNPYHLNKETSIDSYVVVLEEQPLIAYHGDVDGLSGTSLASKNVNKKGKLETKSMASKQYRSYLSNKQLSAKRNISQKLQRDVEYTGSYDIVLNGFSAELSPSEALLINQMDGIKSVDRLFESKIQTDSGPEYSGAMQVWQGTSNFSGSMGEGMIIGVIDSGIASYKTVIDDISDTENLPAFNPSFTAEVDEDNDNVIDYIHTNPRGQYYGDCIDQPNWCSDKLIGVYVFGDDLKNGYITNADGSDDRSGTGQDSNGHGTHVAATAAGNILYNINTESEIGGGLGQIIPQNFVYERISGVAPRANIISYKICNKYGTCNPNLALEAIEQAIEDHVDVINYSIGSRQRPAWYDHVALAFLNARELADISIAVSAGNDGYNGQGSVRSPGNAPWVMSVAAANSNRGFADISLSLFGGSASYDDDMMFTGKGATHGLAKTEVVYAGDVEYKEKGVHVYGHIHEFDNEHHKYEYKEKWEPKTGVDKDHEDYHEHEIVHEPAKDVFGIEGSCGFDSIPRDKIAGKVVVCNRGAGIARANRSFNLYHADAKGMILINTENSSDTVVADFHSIPSIHLPHKYGRKVREWLKTGKDHQVSISGTALINSETLEPEEDFAGVMGGFSSQGPDIFSANYLVPSITAPGVKILASGLGKDMQEKDTHKLLKSDADFIYRSGTSMASPHVAGMMLLIRAAHPDWSAGDIHSALQLTALNTPKIVGPMVRGKQTFESASHHSTGNGMAQVHLAIETGLVMVESVEKFLDADPYGDIVSVQLPALIGEEIEELPENIKDRVKDLTPNWHGKTELMNLPSLNSGECVYKCSWDRKFTAKKNATWTISSTYVHDGFKINAYFVDSNNNSKSDSISVVTGDEFNIEVTAEIDGEIESIWSEGRVVLESNSQDIPTVSLPVTVKFVAGSTPEEIEVTTNRDTGEVVIKDIISSGTENFTAYTTSLHQGEIFEGTAFRAPNPDNLLDEMNKSSFKIPLSIQANSSRVIIEVLETSSPDLDIYLVRDKNLDGKLQYSEAGDIPLYEASSDRYEALDIAFPTHGDFLIMVHNYGNHFNQEDDEEYDPIYSELEDFIKVRVTVVKDTISKTSDDLSIVAAKQGFADSEIPVTVKWHKEMIPNEHYFGMVSFGTSEQLLGNIGTTGINVIRGKDDVSLELFDLDEQNQLVTFTVEFMANNTDADKMYDMAIDIPELAELKLLQYVDSIEGEITNGQGFDFEQDVEQLTWLYTHKAGAAAKVVSLVYSYSKVEGYTNIVPVVTSKLNDEDYVQIAYSDSSIMIDGRPILAIEQSTTLAEVNEQVTLTAKIVDTVQPGARMNISWLQTQGPKVEVIYTKEAISFNMPEINKDEAIVFELSGNNGLQEANPVTAHVYADVEETGSGGSFYLMLFLLLTSLTYRRLSVK